MATRAQLIGAMILFTATWASQAAGQTVPARPRPVTEGTASVPAPPRRLKPTVPVDDLNRASATVEVQSDDAAEVVLPATEPTPPTKSSPTKQVAAKPTTRSIDRAVMPTSMLLPADAPPESTHQDVVSAARQHSQVVHVEWDGPSQITVGQPFSYELIVRNGGSAVARSVIVRDRLPSGVELSATTPTADEAAGSLEWSLGDLEPQEEKRIKVDAVAKLKGEFASSASVTATTIAQTVVRVTEPLLAVKDEPPREDDDRRAVDFVDRREQPRRRAGGQRPHQRRLGRRSTP